MEKSILKKEVKIDFTKSGNFKSFNKKVKQYILKNKTKRTIQITDYIYPFKGFTENMLEIKDHINLSGFNPLVGPRFISLTNIYNSKSGIIVVGLREGTYPNNKEKKILLSANAQAYCYNLVPTVIFATSLGLKIKAFGVVQPINQPLLSY